MNALIRRQEAGGELTMLPHHPWLDQTQSIGSDVFDGGWHALICEMIVGIDQIVRDSPLRLELRQLKEKMGSLRFYYRLHGASAAQETTIAAVYQAAELRSSSTCIRCGAPGGIRSHTGWIAPLCDQHA